MIVLTRQYIDTIVKRINPNFRQIDDPFGDDSIATPSQVSGYKILFGGISTSNQANFISRELDVSIEVYKKAGLKVSDVFDQAMDEAIRIENELHDPKNTNAPYEMILDSSINGEALPTDDKTVKITISIKLRYDNQF